MVQRVWLKKEQNSTKGKSLAISSSLVLLQPSVDPSLDMTLESQVLFIIFFFLLFKVQNLKWVLFTGGVTSMDEFLSKFFPQLEKQRVKAKHETAYCKFDDQKLQLFTSSLYLAALVASFVASVVTRKYGRKVSMFTGGLAFLTGALINAFAINVTMLIIGRLLLGVGVGFANQVRSKFVVCHLNIYVICLMQHYIDQRSGTL